MTDLNAPRRRPPSGGAARVRGVGWQWLLVGVGAAGMLYLSSDRSVATQRPRYPSQEACQRDWPEPRDCESSDSSAGGGGRVWYGPDIDRDGRVYHASGSTSERHPPLSTTSFRGSSIQRSGFGGGFTRGG